MLEKRIYIHFFLRLFLFMQRVEQAYPLGRNFCILRLFPTHSQMLLFSCYFISFLNIISACSFALNLFRDFLSTISYHSYNVYRYLQKLIEVTEVNKTCCCISIQCPIYRYSFPLLFAIRVIGVQGPMQIFG